MSCGRSILLVLLLAVPRVCADVCQLHLSTDSVPDTTDLDSFITSATGAWETPQDRSIAIWRWARRLRRQMRCARQDGRLIWRTRVANGTELVQRVDLASGVVQEFPLGAGQYGQVLGLTPSGAAVFSRELGGSVRFVVWPFESPGWGELPLAPTAGHVVPGR